jgi:hypothetical protein
MNALIAFMAAPLTVGNPEHDSRLGPHYARVRDLIMKVS